MSTAATVDYVKPRFLSGQAYFLLRRLHSLTGLLFGGYICVHLLVNATLIEGARHAGEKTVYQLQVDKIHQLPFLIPIEWATILLPLAFHTLYGIFITVTGVPNQQRYGYGKNWAYFLQRVTAVFILFFALFHVATMKGWMPGALGDQLTFQPAHATQTTINHMHAAWWVGYVIYPIGILASTFHLANGFWAAAITWGLTVSREGQRRWGYVCAGIFVLTTACGIGALLSTLSQTPMEIALEAESKDIPALQYQQGVGVNEERRPDADDAPTTPALPNR